MVAWYFFLKRKLISQTGIDYFLDLGLKKCLTIFFIESSGQLHLSEGRDEKNEKLASDWLDFWSRTDEGRSQTHVAS